MPDITAPGFYEIEADAYHADPAPKPSLNATVITKIVTETLADAKQAHPRLTPREPDEEEEDDNKKFDLGSVAHELLLGRGSGIQVLDFDDYRKGDAQKARKEAIANGLQPCLRKLYEKAEEMVAAARLQLADDPENEDAFTNGRPELVALWQEQTQHGKMWGRAMIDWLMNDRRRVYDYKTFKPGADPENFAKYLAREGRDVQDPWYSRGVAAIEGVDWREIDFRFVVQGTEPPYMLSVVQLDPGSREWSNDRVEWALRKWADAARFGRYRGYVPRTNIVSLPTWAAMDWEQRVQTDQLAEQMLAEAAAQRRA
jgi:hypothetical protein